MKISKTCNIFNPYDNFSVPQRKERNFSAEDTGKDGNVRFSWGP